MAKRKAVNDEVEPKTFPGDPAAFEEAGGVALKTAELEPETKAEDVPKKKMSACPGCGTVFPRKGNKVYCSPECRKEQRSRRKPAPSEVSEERRKELRMPDWREVLKQSEEEKATETYLCGVKNNRFLQHVDVAGVSFDKTTYQIIRDSEGNGKKGPTLPCRLGELTHEKAQEVLDKVIYMFVKQVGMTAVLLDARSQYFAPEPDLEPLARFLVMTPAKGVDFLDASMELSVPTIEEMYMGE